MCITSISTHSTAQPLPPFLPAGVVLYALLVGSLPFNEHPTPLGRSELSRAPRKDVRQVLLRNLRCEWDMSEAAWQHVSQEGRGLVTRMMAVRERYRCTQVDG